MLNQTFTVKVFLLIISLNFANCMEKSIQEENEPEKLNLKASKQLRNEFGKFKKFLNQVGDGKYSFKGSNLPQSKLAQKIQNTVAENIQVKLSGRSITASEYDFLSLLKTVQEESWMVSCPKILKADGHNKTINVILRVEYFGNPIVKLQKLSLGQVKVGDNICQLIPTSALKIEESTFRNAHFNGFIYFKFLLLNMVFSEQNDSHGTSSLRISQIEQTELESSNKEQCIELFKNAGDKKPHDTYERVFVSRDSSSENLLDDGTASTQTISDDEIY